MEKNTKRLVLTALCFYMLTVSTRAQDFLSIDCGAVKGYTDELGIEWVTDDGFIETGTNLQLVDAKFPLASLRYFREGRRKNCYVLPVKNRITYLLRVAFDPGNATSGPAIESPVDFNITVNSNLWFAYSAPSDDSRPASWIDSIFHTWDDREVFVCLLKGTAGYPFINSLELRELPDASYHVAKQDKLLIYFGRYNTGTRPDVDTVVRYPDDPYDRIWFPTSSTDFPAFARVENVSLPWLVDSDIDNMPPNKILEDAWVGRDLSSPVISRPAGVNSVYVVFYFQEVRSVNLTDLITNPTGIKLGVNDIYYELNVTNQEEHWVWFSVDVEKDLYINLTVTSQPWSERDAILSGYEIYETYDIDPSATYPKDRTALKTLQKSFGLQDWTGDPCYPVGWAWLTCDPKTSRINTLELSNMNISGSIPEEISKLTELVEIHLENNNLTGSIPQSMRFLTKLEVLALDNNKLSGQIPDTFQNKNAFTFSGNSGLCLPGNKSCESAPTPAPAPVHSAAVQAAVVEINKKVVVGVILAISVITLAWS